MNAAGCDSHMHVRESQANPALNFRCSAMHRSIWMVRGSIVSPPSKKYESSTGSATLVCELRTSVEFSH